MMAVLNLMSSSPVAMFVKNCSTQQKVMLASVVRCVRREGIAEIPWRNVSPLSSSPSLLLSPPYLSLLSRFFLFVTCPYIREHNSLKLINRYDQTTMPSPALYSIQTTSSPIPNYQ
jgi:hypothetical protein